MKTNVLIFFGLAKVLLLWVKMAYPSLFDPGVLVQPADSQTINILLIFMFMQYVFIAAASNYI